MCLLTQGCYLTQDGLCLQAKRRVYTLQSGGKGAAGKRKRSDSASSDGTTAGMSKPWLTHHCSHSNTSLEGANCCMACLALVLKGELFLQSLPYCKVSGCVGSYCECSHVALCLCSVHRRCTARSCSGGDAQMGLGAGGFTGARAPPHALLVAPGSDS